MTDQLFFLGIGGIGMSALARWHRHHGATVAGHDRTATALTAALEAEGIVVDTTGREDALPPDLLDDLQAGRTDRWTIVRTPAVPEDFPLLVRLREAGFPILKRSELLGRITADRPCLLWPARMAKTPPPPCSPTCSTRTARRSRPSSVASPAPPAPTSSLRTPGYPIPGP